MPVPQGWEHKSLLQQQEKRRVANVCLAFGHHFPSGFLLLFPLGTSSCFVLPHACWARRSIPECLVSHRGSDFLWEEQPAPHILLAQPHVHHYSCWSSGGHSHRATGPQLCCDPVTGSRLAAQAGDAQCFSHSKTSANAAWQQHLAPAGALQGCSALDLGMLGNIWKIWLMTQLKSSLLTARVGLDGL